jgi:hypothetical protein
VCFLLPVQSLRSNPIILSPGHVILIIEASYGVHVDGRSHMGSCIVTGDEGAVHCMSVKQVIVSKSSTEAELIGTSDSANQGVYMRNFLMAKGKPVTT